MTGSNRRPGRTAARLSARGTLLCLALLAAAGSAAEVRPYILEIPDGQAVSFELDFRVANPGPLKILAEWSGTRVLSFRLERTPGRVHKARRSGPSPQTLHVDVHPWDLDGDPTWTLTIRALSGRGGGNGTITLDLPDPPEVVAEREERAEPPPPPPPVPEPWAVARRPRAGASEQELHLFEVVESFRGVAVHADGQPTIDACQWRFDLLRYLAEWRDRLSSEGEIPPIASRRYLARIVAAIQRVEELRSSDDPILAGPAPEDGLRRRAWLAVRRRKIDPLEQELDALVEALRSGHAPELDDQSWPARLISCLTACERHFEQRARLGEDQATNGDLAAQQWEAILVAREALEALAFLSPPQTTGADDAISLTGRR